MQSPNDGGHARGGSLLTSDEFIAAIRNPSNNGGTTGSTDAAAVFEVVKLVRSNYHFSRVMARYDVVPTCEWDQELVLSVFETYLYPVVVR